MNRSSLGNGLWWLARRRMSSQRLTNNHIAIQRQLAKLAQAPDLAPLLRHFGLGLSLIILLMTKSELPKLLFLQPATTQQSDVRVLLEPTKTVAFKYIKIQVRPSPEVTRHPSSNLASDESIQGEDIAVNQVPPSLPSTVSRTKRTKLSALLHQFNHAKKAQDSGYLDEAKELFLTIARSGNHSALGQESYLRALEISRQQNDKQTHRALVSEALSRWPGLKLQAWH